MEREWLENILRQKLYLIMCANPTRTLNKKERESYVIRKEKRHAG